MADFSRRKFLQLSAATGAALAGSRLSRGQAAAAAPAIDRQAVVTRHNPRVTKPDPFSALSVGNGNFAFTTDVTGLQSFIDDYKTDFPLCTASHWGWHSLPMPEGVDPAKYRYKDFDVHGRKVGYATDSKGQEPLFNWLRENPHRLHLGRIGFEIKKTDGSNAKLADLGDINQELNLWTGQIASQFTVEGKPVFVQTTCHPDIDAIAVTVESPLVTTGQLSVLFAFPYGTPNLDMADWDSTDKHQTQFVAAGRRAQIHRIVDDTRYNVAIEFPIGRIEQRLSHEIVFSNPTGGILEFVCQFSPAAITDVIPTAGQTRASADTYWQSFWSDGGAIDLGNCIDPRAPELERRIVLSQYNTALHCSGSMPPAETGLLNNSWYGKFHLEMHWWHAAHFAVWNRFPKLGRSLDYYHRIIQVGRDTAARQGYKGCRWPKMVGPDGRDSPSPVAPLLIWQQPHPIYYAELAYRQDPTQETLDTWRDVVFESAEFMASYAFLDEKTGRYVLGPPMKTVSENADTNTSMDPTYELAYWRFGLKTAQLWRQRLGMGPEPVWANVLAKLAPLPTQDGMYLMQEGMTDTYTKWNWEHPALLGAYGAQPGVGADKETMRATIKKVMEVWQWDRAWGWDFPMAAMAAARSGEPELAVQALLIDSVKNRYHPNGHVYQRPNLAAYLPGNGGLLSATAMMCAGWTDGPTRATPGFPDDGKWSVKFENLRKWM